MDGYWGAAKTLIKQPLWVIMFAAGAVMIAAPCLTWDKNRGFGTHDPTYWFLPGVGGVLVWASACTFILNIVLDYRIRRAAAESDFASKVGLAVGKVEERDGVYSTKVGECEIRVIYGRVQDFRPEDDSVIALPCNEYFDQTCVRDLRGALGAYVNANFVGRVGDFAKLVETSARERFGDGQLQMKIENELVVSFGPGRTLMLKNALNAGQTLALMSTTTQRADVGLVSRISYLFDGLADLIRCLASSRENEVVMPLLGAGHGGLAPPLALVGLLLALAEAIRYGPAARRLRRATIIIYQQNKADKPSVDSVVVKRALALISQQA